MASFPASVQRNPKNAMASPYFWVVVALLVVIALLHYLTPQTRLLSRPVNAFLSRHAVERIVFVLPVVVATHAFRWRGGVFTLVLAVLAMLPRAIWLSPSPGDALIETAAAAAVGSLALWTVEAQARQKVLHQRTASRLSAISAITAIVTRTLDLDQILSAALDKILEVMGLEAGLIFLLEGQSQELLLAVYRGVSEESAAELGQLGLGADVHSGELMAVQNAFQQSPAMQREGLQTQAVVPLRSRERFQGVLVLATQSSRRFLPQDLELFTAIGNEIGVAIENARLYESMRFYARQVIQVQEDERARIARELHDETIQMLIVLSRRLDALIAPSESLSETTKQRLVSLQELIRGISKGIRRYVWDLRPPTLDHLGLAVTINGLARDLTERDEIEAKLRITGESRRLAPRVELALYRIAQEALSNVRRHSGASRAEVRLAFQPDGVRMTVEDNGCGFSVPARMDDLVSTGRLGLIGMDERARTLGGTLTVQSEPGRGTVVTVDIPIVSEPGEARNRAQEDSSGSPISSAEVDSLPGVGY